MLKSADYAVIVAYFIATLLLGFWSAYKAKKSARGYFVAEKALPWWVIGFSMVAASISAEQMLGEVGYGFGAGLVVSNWDLCVYPSLLLMIFIFLPLYLRSRVTTIPEYLELRYGKGTRLLFAIYTIFNNSFITQVMVLALGATAMKYFMGISPLWGAIILIVSTGIYTIGGGMLSVAWTQTLQCIILLLGGLLVFGIGLYQVPGHWSGLFERMGQTGADHLIRPLSDPYVPWPGLILLMLSTNVWYCCTNQFYVQSCLGAKDERHGRLGVLFTAFLGPILTLCFAFPGYIASDLLRNGLIAPLPLTTDGVTDADATYPHLVEQLLSPGFRGFLVAAVLAAIMSTIAAIANATSSVFANDLYKRWIRPGASDTHLVRVGQIVGFISLLIAVPLALLVADYKYIFTYSQNAWCILAIPIMLVFTYGILWKRATNTAAIATFIFVTPFVAVPFIFGNTADNNLTLPICHLKIHLFNFAAILWLVAGVFMFVVSLVTKPSDPVRIAPFVWRSSFTRMHYLEARELHWYQRVGLWAIVGGIMYIVIYAKFW